MVPACSMPAPSPRPAPVSGRQGPLFQYGEIGQERQDAALGRYPGRRSHRRALGLYLEPEETMRTWLNALQATALLMALSAVPARPMTHPNSVSTRTCRRFPCTIAANPTAASTSRWHRRLRRTRPAAPDPVVRKQARRRFEPRARSQRAALGRPLLPPRQLCPDQGFPRGARHQDRETAGFRGATGPDHRRRVPLGVLTPSHPTSIRR